MELPGQPVVPLLLLLSLPAAGATTWYVDAAGAGCPGSGTAGDPFCSIQDAVDAAAPGDLVLVAAGVYTESLSVTTADLVLRGAGAGAAVLIGDAGQDAIEFLAPGGFTLEGFSVLSAGATGTTRGLDANGALAVGSEIAVKGCVFTGHGIGLRCHNAFFGSSFRVEDTVVERSLGDGIAVHNELTVVRGCTVVQNGARGIQSVCCGDQLVVESTLIAGNAWWAIENEAGNQIPVLQHDLVFANNKANPPFAPNAGPFVLHDQELGGIWIPFSPAPGPILTADPLLVDPAAGDYRPLFGSPCTDAGVPGPAAAGGPYDLQGFGHPRIADGDFDGVARVDIGAHEYGGLQSPSVPAVGALLILELGGPAAAPFGVFLGFEGSGLPLGAAGTLFLDPALLVLLTAGQLPASGVATILSAPVPAALVGTAVPVQGGTLSPAGAGGLVLTNLEELAAVP